MKTIWAYYHNMIVVSAHNNDNFIYGLRPHFDEINLLILLQYAMVAVFIFFAAFDHTLMKTIWTIW